MKVNMVFGGALAKDEHVLGGVTVLVNGKRTEGVLTIKQAIMDRIELGVLSDLRRLGLTLPEEWKDRDGAGRGA